MPKKNPKKKFSVSPHGLLPFPKRYRWRIILVIILVLIAAFFVVRQVQIVQERNDYRKAEVVLERLYGEIESKIGKADKVERKRSCSYSSAKFSKGILRCSVSISSSRSIDHVDKSSLLANQIIDILKQDTKIRVSYYEYDKAINFSKKDDYSRIGESSRDYEIIGNSRRCYVGFEYMDLGKTKQLERAITDSPGGKLSTTISCGGGAKTEHFPVRQ